MGVKMRSLNLNISNVKMIIRILLQQMYFLSLEKVCFSFVVQTLLMVAILQHLIPQMPFFILKRVVQKINTVQHANMTKN